MSDTTQCGKGNEERGTGLAPQYPSCFSSALSCHSSPKKPGRKSAGRQPQNPSKRSHDEAADRKAALAFEKEQKRRERERAKEEAAGQKERERRQHAVDKAQGAFDAARRRHESITTDIQQQLGALEEKGRAEEARWEKEKVRLEAALQRARG
jgi:hypothetical protein